MLLHPIVTGWDIISEVKHDDACATTPEQKIAQSLIVMVGGDVVRSGEIIPPLKWQAVRCTRGRATGWAVPRRFLLHLSGFDSRMSRRADMGSCVPCFSQKRCEWNESCRVTEGPSRVRTRRITSTFS